MSIFKKKTKSKKEETKPADDTPKPAPYRHVPQHAASDAVSNGNSNRPGEKEQIMRASQYRMANARNEYANAGHAQAIAHNAMHNTPSPSSNAGQQMQWNRFQSMSRNNSTEVFTTDPSAPPMPPTPRSITPGARSQRNGMPRNNSGYFQGSSPAPTYDNSSLGNHKTAVAARDRGYVSNPHYSADSGYGSAGPSSAVHSRAPSEQNYMGDALGPQPHLPRTNSGFLPELSLSEELAREPAFSEHSFGGDEPAETPQPRKTPESAMKSSRGHTSHQEQDARSVKSSKSGSKPKQTRFEEVAQPAEPQVQDKSQSTPIAKQYSRPEPVTAANSRFEFDLPSSTPSAVKTNAYEDPRPVPTPARKSSPAPARDRESEKLILSPVRYSSPPPQAMSQFSPIERVMSATSHRSTMPTPNILEGHKVNKKGKVLDEEGDIIGELYEGDLMDCVRQKVGTYGEVLDDYGSVVGRVRVVHRPIESPVLRSTTPVPSIHQVQQQDVQQYYQPTPHRPQSPAITSTRRVSSASHAEVFTPAWQQSRVPQQYPVLAQELRNHLATAPEGSQTAVAPLDQSNGVYPLELDASEPMEEPLPIFDHSDVFMPPPFVPARSPLRTPSPSPFIEHRHLRGMNAADHMAPMSEETAARAAKYFSAPPGQRQWAAAELIQRDDSDQDVPDASAQQPQSAPMQQLGRSASDAGTSDTPRSFARPAMSPVPEHNSLAEEQEEENPTQYTYKGEIPAEDGPVSNVRGVPSRAVGAKSPPLPSFPRQAMSGSPALPNQFPPMSSAQFSSAGGLGPRRAPYSAGIPSLKPQLNTRNSFNAPLRRSPLSSHGTTPSTFTAATASINTDGKAETTPPESETGSEDGKHTKEAHMHSHSRAPSVRTMMSSRTVQQPAAYSGKPRTYFTHGGQVQIQPGQSPTAKYVPPRGEAQKLADNVSVSGQSTASKKKSRFSFGFGKKNQAVAAH